MTLSGGKRKREEAQEQTGCKHSSSNSMDVDACASDTPGLGSMESHNATVKRFCCDRASVTNRSELAGHHAGVTSRGHQLQHAHEDMIFESETIAPSVCARCAAGESGHIRHILG